MDDIKFFYIGWIMNDGSRVFGEWLRVEGFACWKILFRK